MLSRLGSYLDALINNFAQVNAMGFANIIHNPLGLLFIAVAIILIIMFIKTKVTQLIYLAFFISACGYGSIVRDGLKLFVDALGQLVTG